jgi:hypothetical protein
VHQQVARGACRRDHRGKQQNEQQHHHTTWYPSHTWHTRTAMIDTISK